MRSGFWPAKIQDSNLNIVWESVLAQGEVMLRTRLEI